MKTFAFATLVLLAAAPAVAATAGEVPTFRALEFKHADHERVSAAEHHFGNRLPAGTPVAEAHQVLTAAGARCETGATLTCRYSGHEAIENALRQVHWTVDVNHADGAVTDLKVQRESIGA